MARVEIELNNGTKKIVELDDNFTDSDIDEISRQLNSEITSNDKPQQKGIDLTPSGLIDNTANAIVSAIETPYRMVRDKQNPIKAFQSAYNVGKNARKSFEKEHPILSGTRDLGIDLLGYGLLPNKGGFVGQAAIQGGLPFALESLKEGENPLSGFTKGTELGIALQGVVPVAKFTRGLPLVKPVLDTTGRFLGAAKQGLLESYAMGKNVIDRLKTSPRGTNLSRFADKGLGSNGEYGYGSEEFMNDIARRFKEGIDSFRNQEVKAFSDARNNLINNNQDVNVDLTGFVDDVYGKLRQRGFIDAEGNLTPAGKKATGISSLLDDLNYYRGNFDLNQLQSLKADVLDDVINYKPGVGQTLNNATRGLQGIAKDARKYINDLLKEKLGVEYSAINDRLSGVLNSLDNIPELKDLTNVQNIDTLATKLKKTGTVRIQTQKELENLERLMNENGVTISENGLVNDILDYNAAKEIKNRIRTGQDTDYRNILRRSVVQPLTEFHLDRIVPFSEGIKQNLSPLAQRLLKPFISRSIAPMMLQGGVSNVTDNYGYGYDY